MAGLSHRLRLTFFANPISHSESFFLGGPGIIWLGRCDQRGVSDPVLETARLFVGPNTQIAAELGGTEASALAADPMASRRCRTFLRGNRSRLRMVPVGSAGSRDPRGLADRPSNIPAGIISVYRTNWQERRLWRCSAGALVVALVSGKALSPIKGDLSILPVDCSTTERA